MHVLVDLPKNKGPTGGVPGPAGEGAVDNGEPCKEEDHDGANLGAFRETTDGEDRSDHGKAALVTGEKKSRDAARASRGCLENTLEAKVAKVTDKGRGAVRECERVAPEEPLEGCDGNAGHGQEDHAQCVLATQETRVEETDARDHDPHKSHGGDDPGHVTELVDNGLAVGIVGD